MRSLVFCFLCLCLCVKCRCPLLSGFLIRLLIRHCACPLFLFLFLLSAFILSLNPPARESPYHPVTLSHCTLSPLVSVRDPLSHTVGHCGKLRVAVAWLWGAVAWLWVAVFSCVLLCLCAFVPGYSVRHWQISTSGLHARTQSTGIMSTRRRCSSRGPAP